MKENQRSYLYKIYIITSSVGLEVVLSVAVGIFAGLWIDKRYQSSPWGLLGGACIGAMSAARRLIAFTRNYLR
ncbi:MAG: AtpZ/AtpI family protein [Myxococcota bacterium]